MKKDRAVPYLMVLTTALILWGVSGATERKNKKIVPPPPAPVQKPEKVWPKLLGGFGIALIACIPYFLYGLTIGAIRF